MAYNFRAADRDQQFLMPPSVREWLPEGHLAWFVLDVVDQLDLAAFYAKYRLDGRGGGAYDPAMMVALLVYAYCIGERSSRLIERRCVEDVGYRVVAANAAPDHATIARFRAEHEAALAELFTQMLGLCAQAGMVRVGVVALDGTKLGAAAAKDANHDAQWVHEALRTEAERIVREAAAVDEAEDAVGGGSAADELPLELTRRPSRLRRLQEAKAHLDAAATKRSEIRSAEKNNDGDGRRDRVEGDPEPGPPKRLLVNVTDPASNLMKVPGGWMQAFNAQAIATPEQVVIAAELTNATVDFKELAPMLARATANLVAAEVADPIGVLLADAGYYSTDNATLDVGVDLLIATAKAHKLPTTPSAVTDRIGEADRKEAELVAGRAAILGQVMAGKMTVRQAAAALGLCVARTYVLYDRFRADGPHGLVRKHRKGAKREKPRRARIVQTRDAMQARLASDKGRALYRQRSQIIEPVFGQIKDARGIRRFSRRGLMACDSEWKLIAATHNLLKLRRRKVPLSKP